MEQAKTITENNRQYGLMWVKFLHFILILGLFYIFWMLFQLETAVGRIHIVAWRHAVGFDASVEGRTH